MPLIFSKEWWKTDTNPVADGLQAAGIMAAFQMILKASSNIAEQTRILQKFEKKELDEDLKARKKEIENWPWRWKHPAEADIIQLYLVFARRWATDEEFRKRQEELMLRWTSLADRAEQLHYNISPMYYMPRSACGDVAGSYMQLVEGMDKLEKIIGRYERKQNEESI